MAMFLEKNTCIWFSQDPGLPDSPVLKKQAGSGISSISWKGP